MNPPAEWERAELHGVDLEVRAPVVDELQPEDTRAQPAPGVKALLLHLGRESTASVGVGLAVGRDALIAGTAKLGGAGFEGITVADETRQADSYAVGEIAGVLRKGSIWVTASTAVTIADPVTFTAATGVIGAGLATTIANAKFSSAGAIGDLVRVYLG